MLAAIDMMDRADRRNGEKTIHTSKDIMVPSLQLVHLNQYERLPPFYYHNTEKYRAIYWYYTILIYQKIFH